ncbi:MAG: hypothetical protein EP341_07685 [Sphingomonadales bacterium]|nr:MAG: hypothetical protein EP341_07685 [Sphingomonadales bacterium]
MIQSVLANLGQLAISLALVIIVSRILPPDEVGAFLMAYAVILLVLPLRDFQLQSYVIQCKEFGGEDLGQVSFAAWASSLSALAICLAGAAVFGALYPGEAIAPSLLIMAMTFLIRPFSLPAMSLLARELNYGVISAIRLCSAIIRAAVTLGLLWGGIGVEALAWGVLAEGAVELCALWFLPVGKRVIAPVVKGSRKIFTYCAPYTGAHSLVTLSVALVPILIGGFQGLAMTAFFNRGRTVMQFFRSGVEGAIQPIVLSQFTQAAADKPTLLQSYCHATALLTGITWPTLVWLIICAEPLSVALFGPEWAAVAPFAQFLSAGALLYSATAFSQQLHAAIDQTRYLLWRDAILQVTLIAITVVAVQFSAIAVAKGFVIYAALGFMLHQALLKREIGLDLGRLLRATFASLLVAVISGAASLVVLHVLSNDWKPLNLIFLLAVTGAFAWVVALVVTRHPLLAEARTIIAR